jgi:hypothetical protein
LGESRSYSRVNNNMSNEKLDKIKRLFNSPHRGERQAAREAYKRMTGQNDKPAFSSTGFNGESYNGRSNGRTFKGKKRTKSTRFNFSG